jgi:hypothetical protein
MKKYIFWVGLVLLFISGCVKDSFELDKLKGATYSPSIAAPIVTAELSLKDMIAKNNNDLIQIDNEGFITLVFGDTLFSSIAEDILVLPDQSATQSISPGIVAPAGMPTSPAVTYSEVQTMVFAAGNNQLNKLYLKEGTFNLSGESSISANIDVTISITTATLNGVPFVQTLNLNPNGSDNSSVDLNGYIFDLTNGGTTSNELEVSYSMVVSGTGQPVSASDQVDFSIGITGLKFSKVVGIMDLADMTPEQDTVEVTLFNGAAGIGSFNLVSPKLKIYSNNSFGATVDIDFDIMEGINTISGSTYNLVTSGTLPSPWSIAGPSAGEEGQSKRDSLIVTGNDIIGMINDQPKFLVYALKASTPSTEMFILDTSKLVFNTVVELPLHGSIENFVMIDTLNLDLGMESVQDLVLTSIINNGFPIEFKLSLDAWKNTDNGWEYLASAYVDNDGFIAASGEVDGTGRVINRTETRTDITLDSVQTKHFSNANKIIITAAAATTNAGLTNVKFYEDYSLGLKIGVIANIEL